MQIITTKQHKLDKSRDKGVLTAGIQLSPAHEARAVLNRPDLRTVCPFSGACEVGCLKFTGLNQMSTHALARAKRTALYWDNPTAFYDQVIHELHAVERKAERLGLAFAIRPNMLQDLPPLADRIARAFPNAAIYDFPTRPSTIIRRYRPHGGALGSWQTTPSPTRSLNVVPTGRSEIA